MRISGGTAGGRRLDVPKGIEVRPTPDVVRQAIFNSLGSRVHGASVLELFAGTGALSLECLSRGASRAVCVEKSPRHAQYLRRNLAAADVKGAQFEVRVQDAFIAIGHLAAAGASVDLILADPPYGRKNIGQRSQSFAQQLLDDPRLPFLLSREGLFVLGHARRDTLDPPRQWTEVKRLRHGDSVIRIFRPEVWES